MRPVAALAPARAIDGGLGNVAIGALIVTALYLGRDVFVPIALAILFSFVLAPLVKGLQKLRVPRSLAVITVVLIAFSALGALTVAMVNQATQLAGELPVYQSTMREKIASLRGAGPGSGVLSRAADVLQDLGKELDRPKANEGSSLNSPVRPPDARPIPVEVHQPEPGALETLRAFLTPLIHPLTTTGIVLIFVVFILLQREDLRNRFIRLTGTYDLQKTTAAFDDAARRLSRLFLTQLVLNAGFGLVIGTGLWMIGVPSALLWGILSAILRFIPYLGAILSAIFPMVIAASVDPGWTMLAWTAALFLVAEPLAGHVVEPLVYGRSTGLSPVAIVVAATFWTWLWGPIGLVLATPLTVCLVVLGRHVERLEFLDVLLGDRPALSAPEIFYQRVLAGDPAEAADKAEEVLKERSLSIYYDEVALEGLRLAANDAARGVLDATRQTRILETVREVVDDLADHDDRNPAVGETTNDPEAEAAIAETDEAESSADLPILTSEDLGEAFRGEDRVVCIAAQSELDEAAALMLAQILGKHGLPARVLPADTLSTNNLAALAADQPALICLCYLDGTSSAHMKYAIKRLRRRLPSAIIILGSLAPAAGSAAQLKASVLADEVETSLRGMSNACLTHAMRNRPPSPDG
ncbi:AI-2E family transporter [Bosea sp. BIWAKO-01]|uniref:AI-2E family transporter n=1 Tax=Bosea sp. BIWAKO-01 TaxID=506668 RepID=UPI000853E600|nr:AI-2E family transporter [Bosea sp. BIWAKO-01]GAU82408.1 transport protein [Bosea sp. BIWAKO-01]